MAEASERKNQKLKEAFGIKEDYTEGSSFNPEHQAAKREAERAEKEQKKKEWEKSLKRYQYLYIYWPLLITVLPCTDKVFTLYKHVYLYV